jgi:lipoprotein-anchoring transpeptidase ErfK/SrfK
MYYSLFWHGAFAIHGYRSVPPWPASHGCVRIPMWQAPRLFYRWPIGTRVYVYI